MNNADTAFFPLDNGLALSDGSYSPGLQREMVWLSGQLTYEAVSDVLERVGQCSIPTASVWQVCQRQGERLVVQAERARNQVGVERLRWNQAEYEPQVRKGVSMDGGMVLVRGEGWKELKVGLVSDLVPPANRTFDTLDEPVSINLHYTAVLGDVADFKPELWRLAEQYNIPYAGQVAVTADGAAWIWNLTADLFPKSTQIVDWYHATQHLETAVQTLFPNPDQASSAKSWRHQLKNHLFAGECFKVIEALQAKGLVDDATYFVTHQRRMQYPAFRAEGFPIGSGATESGVKQFKHRLSGPGMRWSRPGVNRMAVIRAAVLDRSFDDLWAIA